MIPTRLMRTLFCLAPSLALAEAAMPVAASPGAISVNLSANGCTRQ